MSKKCPKCESKDIHITEYLVPTDSMATCYGCGYADLAERFPEQTIFDQITESPETLAEKLVVEYRHGVKDYAYYSTVTYELYNTKSEALAATVAKLKEVVKDDR